MRLWIPPLDTMLSLDEDWTFTLHAEERNKGLMEVVEGKKIRSWVHDGEPGLYYQRMGYIDYDWTLYPLTFTVPAGTVLRLERIYVRRGAEMERFDSLTFRVMSSPDERLQAAGRQFGKGGKRFWARLDECNGMAVTQASAPAGVDV